MSRVAKMCLAAATVSASIAVPAVAQKVSGQKPDNSAKADNRDLPPGLLRAMERAFPEVGHGDDVPRGNGKGWGHLLHDHEDDPISP